MSVYLRTGLEQRLNLEFRQIIQAYIDDGWKVISRDPIVIERGHIKMYYENGVFKYLPK